ncbi:MAG: HAD family hydrolase [Anaerolineae bacterium]
MMGQLPTLILFDIDGTLLRTNNAGRAAFELALHRMFGIGDAVANVSFAGATDLEVLERVLAPLGYSTDRVMAIMPEFVAVMASALTEVLRAYRVEALPGALALIRELVQHPAAHIGLVTGNAARTATIKLRAAGFAPEHFAVGAFGDEAVDRGELAALALARAQQHWGRPFPGQRIVIVGDTPQDIICARAVGGRAVAVLTGFAPEEMLRREAPDALLRDLSDVQTVIAVLLGEVK